MAKAKRLTIEQYAEMKTRYQMGEGIRELAREYSYDAGNLSRRLQKDGAIQGELQQVIQAKVIEATEEFNEKVTTITTDVQQITTEAQKPFVEKELNKRASQWLGIVEDTTDIALRLNQKLLIEVNNRSRPGAPNGYDPHQSAAILRTLGMTQDKLLEQTGISAKPIEPNNPNGNSKLSQIDNSLDASRAYQELINGSK